MERNIREKIIAYLQEEPAPCSDSDSDDDAFKNDDDNDDNDNDVDLDAALRERRPKQRRLSDAVMKERLRALFRTIDKDGNGFLTKYVL